MHCHSYHPWLVPPSTGCVRNYKTKVVTMCSNVGYRPLDNGIKLHEVSTYYILIGLTNWSYEWSKHNANWT
jgi:hypothetical protein